VIKCLVEIIQVATTSTALSPHPSLEMASVLFMDIVSYSLNSMEKQGELLGKLQDIVRRTKQFQEARSNDQLISLPTGDGMALVFFQDPVISVRCALEIQSALRVNPELRLRAGVHIGPVFRRADIKDEINVVGGGINLAQRVMDCGDVGHILISSSVAEVLLQLSEWPPYLHDLGECEVKHGVRIHLYNVYNDTVGNPELPAKLKKPALPARPRAWRWVALAVGVVVLLIASYAAYHLSRSPDPNLPVAAQRTIRYYILVQKYRGGKPYQDPFRLSGERVFEADYRIRLVVANSEPGHLYVLNEGPKSTSAQPDLNTLFPSPTTQEGSSWLQPGQQIDIPQGGYFVFDKQSGTEKLWLIWSRAAIPELEALKKWANPTDRGAMRDVGQAREIDALLNKYAVHQASAAVDQQNRMTVLAAAGELLARRLDLDHD
jgi:class 3 adenylate cyclase